ncbi:hydroxymethylbilane synthase [Desulfohalobiaceae bacterium Ax17]|jgi:hydroxymethylbilane synthase|uniref:hydroxymethylbilane synthase n=1 Tax=Desulfovulcanus ferrireducens TaxID=2831190 RepID=UPI00207BBB87|nr:hydroxymethylbilane synthase [Desulfovulcanus ferrireducens]MBT8764183.1 hydroxymethylbilane synthase [Desulfovulcanus ferrireducens]
MNRIIIATRGSKLALWQAEHIAGQLMSRYPDLEVRLLKIKTKGDKILDVPLAKVGGKGLFVKEIEEALMDGRADIAVHSMKDVPTELPAGLKLGIIPERESPEDLLLSCKYENLMELPEKARVGTSSLRRQAQLLQLRPDLDVVSLRGNLDTRVRKLKEGQFDAIVVAKAGMRRLGLTVDYEFELAPPSFLPAVAQGALGIEYAEGRQDLDELLGFMDHAPTRFCVQAERAFLHGLDGGCQVPIACYARYGDDQLRISGLVADLKGERMVRKEKTGKPEDAWQLGHELAQEVLKAGAREILGELYA